MRFVFNKLSDMSFLDKISKPFLVVLPLLLFLSCIFVKSIIYTRIITVVMIGFVLFLLFNFKKLQEQQKRQAVKYNKGIIILIVLMGVIAFSLSYFLK